MSHTWKWHFHIQKKRSQQLGCPCIRSTAQHSDTCPCSPDPIHAAFVCLFIHACTAIVHVHVTGSAHNLGHTNNYLISISNFLLGFDLQECVLLWLYQFKMCLQRSQMTLDPGTLSPLSHSGCPLTVALGCPFTYGVHTGSHTLELNESLSHKRMHINTCCTYWEESAWVSWSALTNTPDWRAKIHDSRHTSAQP